MKERKILNTNKRWLTPKDLEVEFGIKKATQAKMRMKKVIPFSKVGSKFIRYDRLEIDKWFEQHKIVGVEA